MSGYGLPGLLGVVGVLGTINAVLTRIWASKDALTVWLIIVGGAVLLIIFVEVVNRRNVLEVGGERISWSLRQPPDKGHEPLSSLRTVELVPTEVRLVFERHTVIANRILFRRGDMRRFVEQLRGLGVQVNEQPSVS